MKKNGRTFREDIKLVRRGMKEFEKLLPRQMLWVTLKCIIGAALPYVAVILSACIINELLREQNSQRLISYISISIGLTFTLYLCKAALEAKITVGYSRLFSTHELVLTDKAHRLPYELLESDRVRDLRERVSGSINLSGAGMASLYWDMDVVITNLCSAVISMILCIGFVGELLRGEDKWYAALGCFVCLAGLITICAYVSCKMTGKRFDVAFEVFEEGAKYKRYGEFYTLDYLSDEEAALDVRIFKQKELILNETWERCYEHFAKGQEKEAQAVNLYDGVKLICTVLCGAAVYLVVGINALQGRVGIGNVVMLHGAVTGLILALSQLAQIWTDLRNNNEHLLHFFEYMDLPEDTSEECRMPRAKVQQAITGAAPIQEIRLEQVSFRYPDTDEFVLQNVNLTMKGGEKLALVGENGSGKTTLVKLLCGLYQPTEGRILLNGKDIRSYSKEEHGRLMATVFQDFALFPFSVGENVAATGSYDEEKVKAALRQAGLGEKLAKWPQGVRQILFHDFAEEGENLSGGEAQKLAIARALYKDAPLMILDEPTAALDPFAEFEIYEQLRRLAENKTLVSISHRLSSCRMCDRILVLDRGRLIQDGSHEALLQLKQGKYYEMWQAQAQYYL